MDFNTIPGEVNYNSMEKVGDPIKSGDKVQSVAQILNC